MCKDSYLLGVSMQELYLTSSFSTVAAPVAACIGTRAHGMPAAFIDTAAEPVTGDRQWLEDDRSALVAAGFDVFDYTLTGKTRGQVEADLARAGLLFISGGENLHLFTQVRQSGFCELAGRWVRHGSKIYIGSSAGSILAGPHFSPTCRPEEVAQAGLSEEDLVGLGLVNFVVLPHWGSDYFQEVYFGWRLAHAYTARWPLIPLPDDQYVRVKGDWWRMEGARPLK